MFSFSDLILNTPRDVEDKLFRPFSLPPYDSSEHIILNIFSSSNSVFAIYLQTRASIPVHLVYFATSKPKGNDIISNYVSLDEEVKSVVIDCNDKLACILTELGTVFLVSVVNTAKQTVQPLIFKSDMDSKIVKIQIYLGYLFLLCESGKMYSMRLLMSVGASDEAYAKLEHQNVQDVICRARLAYIVSDRSLYEMKIAVARTSSDYLVKRTSKLLKIVTCLSPTMKFTKVQYQRDKQDEPVMMTLSNAQLFILTVGGDILSLNGNAGFASTQTTTSTSTLGVYKLEMHPEILAQGIRSIRSTFTTNLIIVTKIGNIYGCGMNKFGELGTNRKSSLSLDLCLSYEAALQKFDLSRDFVVKDVECSGWTTLVWFKSRSAATLFLKGNRHQATREFVRTESFYDVTICVTC